MNDIAITTEEYREYHYANGDVYRIDAPTRLWWKRDDDGDSHRILDASNVTHYPRRGWIAITWKAPTEPVSF